MITLISTKDCPTCEMVKKQFDAFNIKYLDVNYEELDKDIQEQIMEKAKKEGKMNFPIMLKNGEMLNVDEAIGRRI